jgi:hypothetical protein
MIFIRKFELQKKKKIKYFRSIAFIIDSNQSEKLRRYYSYTIRFQKMSLSVMKTVLCVYRNPLKT